MILKTIETAMYGTCSLHAETYAGQVRYIWRKTNGDRVSLFHKSLSDALLLAKNVV